MDRSDLTLLATYASSRDAEAFAAIVRRHTALVYGTCMRILHSDADAQDVTQSCFFELARNPKAPRTEKDSLVGYLHTLARCRSLDALRRAASRQHHEQATGTQPQVGQDSIWDDIMPHVDAAIAALPPELREPLLLNFFEKHAQSSIAEKLGIDQATVSRRINKAIEMIRAHLTQSGATVTAIALTTLLTGNAASASVPDALEASLTKMALAGPRKRMRIVAPFSIGVATIAITLMATAFIVADILFPRHKPVTPPSETAMGTEASIRLADLPPGHEGNSYVVALEIIHHYLSPQRTISYSRLMGLSGMAFITQAMPQHEFEGKVDVGWWPLDSWGFHARTDFLGKAIGWNLRRVSEVEDEFRADPTGYYHKHFAPEVRASLAAGKPVLGDHDRAFIITSQPVNALPLGRSGCDKQVTPVTPEGQPPCPWGLLIFDHPVEPMDAKAADAEALRHALVLAQDAAAIRRPDHFTGQKAWRAWSAFLRQTDKPTENRHHANMLMHLRMQRAAAASFLRDTARRWDAPINEHLLAAAERYDDLHQELSAMHVGDVQNNNQSRKALADLVDQWSAMDAAAIGEIQKALGAIQKTAH